jgi:hypothetical protein
MTGGPRFIRLTDVNTLALKERGRIRCCTQQPAAIIWGDRGETR